MKTAIVCDWLVTIGGAEKFLHHLLNCFPQADLFAVIDFVPPAERHWLQHKPVTTTFIQHLPFAKRYYRHFLPLMPLAIEQLDLSAYDLIISSSHAVAKGVITGPDQLHICYIHSPMRYAWDLQQQYLVESGLDKKLHGWLARYFLHRLRLWDLRSAVGVDAFIANSKFIARRVHKTYRRAATVIYPPIESAKFQPSYAKEDFYLAVSRLVPYKRMDLIAATFKALPDKKLIIIGDGPDYAKVKAQAGENVSFLGYQDEATVINHMQRARALIFAAYEDFGLVPVEAQSCGTPVIAYGKGGALETVCDLSQPNPTGVFFATQTPAAIRQAIALFEQKSLQITPANCIANAQRFSFQTFQTQLEAFIHSAHSQKQQNEDLLCN
jgi:glycosyltransferase involved in cell wall biosynthesis